VIWDKKIGEETSDEGWKGFTHRESIVVVRASHIALVTGFDTALHQLPEHLLN
jgi:hypothetical protein